MLQQMMLLVWKPGDAKVVNDMKAAGLNVNSESLSTIKLHDYHVAYAHFLATNTLDLYNERVLDFDDWGKSIPFITQETVFDPVEATLEFFETN